MLVVFQGLFLIYWFDWQKSNCVHLSSTSLIKCGVPQGSILEPMYFMEFIQILLNCSFSILNFKDKKKILSFLSDKLSDMSFKMFVFTWPMGISLKLVNCLWIPRTYITVCYDFISANRKQQEGRGKSIVPKHVTMNVQLCVCE